MKRIIKSISIDQARNNMILANSVRDKEGKILYQKGIKLDYNAISKIKQEGNSLIYIYQFLPHKSYSPDKDNSKKNSYESKNTNKEEIIEEAPPKIEENVVVKEEVLASNINDKEEEKYSIPASPAQKPPLKDVISIEIRQQGEQLVKDLFANPDKVKYENVMGLVSHVVNEILTSDENIISVQDLRDYDNYTYQHSVNLCVLGVTVGKFLNYTERQLKDFGVGLLFHDFGKTKVPLEVLNKPGRLTPEEFEIMKKHPEYGYQVLNKKFKLPDVAKMVIRHHHEKLDGTGYPLGLKGEEIPEWVQISTIVDVYDALTSDRIYKSKWTHKNAIKFLYERSTKWFNIEYIKILESTIPERKETFTLLDF